MFKKIEKLITKKRFKVLKNLPLFIVNIYYKFDLTIFNIFIRQILRVPNNYITNM